MEFSVKAFGFCLIYYEVYTFVLKSLITPYIRILDFDWLIANVFSYLGLISFIFTAARVFA
jgi:hypothetical protein